MRSANLIPAYRLAARQRHRRIRVWMSAGIAYLLVLLGIYAACYGLWGHGLGTVTGDQETTSARMQEVSRRIRAAQSELEALDQRLKAGQAVENQPDWSVLLAVLPESTRGDIVLTQCELMPDRPAATAAVPSATNNSSRDAAAAYSLRIAGFGQTIAAVLRFAQELERMGLFDQVRLVRTNGEPFLSGTATRFQIECTLGGKAGTPT
jgi:Tfp pilus assembly protein PilN